MEPSPTFQTLPARYYTDPVIFRDEMERFYFDSWICAGRDDVICRRVAKSHERQLCRATVTGKIRTLRVDKGFGFIKDDSGKEYFFHQSAVYGEGLEDLREGDSVEFDVGQGPKGPRAENVRRTST